MIKLCKFIKSIFHAKFRSMIGTMPNGMLPHGPNIINPPSYKNIINFPSKCFMENPYFCKKFKRAPKNCFGFRTAFHTFQVKITEGILDF